MDGFRDLACEVDEVGSIGEREREVERR